MYHCIYCMWKKIKAKLKLITIFFLFHIFTSFFKIELFFVLSETSYILISEKLILISVFCCFFEIFFIVLFLNMDKYIVNIKLYAFKHSIHNCTSRSEQTAKKTVIKIAYEYAYVKMQFDRIATTYSTILKTERDTSTKLIIFCCCDCGWCWLFTSDYDWSLQLCCCCLKITD